WDSIDLEERMLRVCASVARSSNGMPTIGSPKSKTSDRLIPISHKLTQLLKSEKMLASSDYVFAAPRNGSFLNPRTLQYHFRSLLEKEGLPLVKFHALRHTFATRWIECGMDVKMLSEVLGHGSVQITLDIYVHSSDQRKREAIEKIELFSGQNSGQENAESVA
ncbi:MAG: site-specific integrase, partial [Lachnospiraceae bacterium]|nr:site-specific integrase [Lachnospiraceae bacterium]